MSDSFELRLKFLQQLKTLNASQPSIEKLVGFCIKHGAQCGEDLWECVLEQTQQVRRFKLRAYVQSSLNTRINILYFLDSLCDLSITVGPPDAPYLHLVARDLAVVVNNVVPDSREGVLNLMSAKQVGR
jgi:CTD kinase subunit gamma